MSGGTASAAASTQETASTVSPPGRARYSRTTPSTPSADAVEATIRPHHAIVGAQEWVRATTVSAATAHRWGTQSLASGGGTPSGLTTRSASDPPTRNAVISVASL